MLPLMYPPVFLPANTSTSVIKIPGLKAPLTSGSSWSWSLLIPRLLISGCNISIKKTRPEDLLWRKK